MTWRPWTPLWLGVALVMTSGRPATGMGSLEDDPEYIAGLDRARQGQFEPARRILESVVARRPGSARARFALGMALLELARPEDVRRQALAILARDHQDPLGLRLIEASRRPGASPRAAGLVPESSGGDPAVIPDGWDQGEAWQLLVDLEVDPVDRCRVGSMVLLDGPAIPVPGGAGAWRLDLVTGEGRRAVQEFTPPVGLVGVVETFDGQGRISGRPITASRSTVTVRVPFLIRTDRLEVLEADGTRRLSRSLTDPEVADLFETYMKPAPVPGTGARRSDDRLTHLDRLVTVALSGRYLVPTHDAQGRVTGMVLALRRIAELYLEPALRRVGEGDLDRVSPYLSAPQPPVPGDLEEGLVELRAALEHHLETAPLGDPEPVRSRWKILAPRLRERVRALVLTHRRAPTGDGPTRALTALTLARAGHLMERLVADPAGPLARAHAAQTLLLMGRLRFTDARRRGWAPAADPAPPRRK